MRISHLLLILINTAPSTLLIAAAARSAPMILDREHYYQMTLEQVQRAHPDADHHHIRQALQAQVESCIIASASPLSFPLSPIIYSTLQEHAIPYFYAEEESSRHLRARVFFPVVYGTRTIPLIRVGQNQSNSLKNFLILHELGHVVQNDTFSTSRGNIRQNHLKELQADEFAFKQLLNHKDRETVIAGLDWLLSEISQYTQNTPNPEDHKLSKENSTHPSPWLRAQAGIALLNEHARQEGLRLENISHGYEREGEFVKRLRFYFPEYREEHIP